MTDPLDAYGDALRRALHAEADAVVPSPDGLEHIRARISERQRRLGWAWFTETWGRPAIALAAAVGIAALAISATPAINAIQGIATGDGGAAGTSLPNGSVGNGTSAPGWNGRPGQPYPGAARSPVPTATPKQATSPAVGAPTCGPSGDTVATPTSTPISSAQATIPCTSASASSTPTTPDPVVTPPTTEPSTSDTPSATSEPPPQDQGQASQSQP